MKYTAPLVIAALLGFSDVQVNALTIKAKTENFLAADSQDSDDELALDEVEDEEDSDDVGLNDSEDDSTQAVEMTDEDSDDDIQLEGDKKDEDPYPAYMHGFGGYHTYMRDVPDRFETEKDDQLMESLYKNYAIEGRKNNLPDGHFWLDEANAKAVSNEVIGTHLKLSGGALKSYIDAQFPTIWKRFDVNEEGKVEIDRMPQFLRMICGSAEACLGL